MASDSSKLKRSLEDYDEALEKFMPVQMAMSRIYWDLGNYPKVEHIFRERLTLNPEPLTLNPEP